jgi:DNA invertase Pin-like site-specific DNA recombinase
MKQEQGNGAVLYIRVSTEEQAKEPMNLDKQEKQCRDLCKQMGVPVVKMFVGSVNPPAR